MNKIAKTPRCAAAVQGSKQMSEMSKCLLKIARSHGSDQYFSALIFLIN